MRLKSYTRTHAHIQEGSQQQNVEGPIFLFQTYVGERERERWRETEWDCHIEKIEFCVWATGSLIESEHARTQKQANKPEREQRKWEPFLSHSLTHNVKPAKEEEEEEEAKRRCNILATISSEKKMEAVEERGGGWGESTKSIC